MESYMQSMDAFEAAMKWIGSCKLLCSQWSEFETFYQRKCSVSFYPNISVSLPNNIKPVYL